MPKPAPVNIHQAKTHFSQLVDRAEAGEEIVIARAGRPVAKLTAFRPSPQHRHPGLWEGRVAIHDDFDADLPDEIADAFDGRAR